MINSVMDNNELEIGCNSEKMVCEEQKGGF